MLVGPDPTPVAETVVVVPVSGVSRMPQHVIQSSLDGRTSHGNREQESRKGLCSPVKVVLVTVAVLVLVPVLLGLLVLLPECSTLNTLLT